jgi:zinc D-Ala-D-Ala carboxypeptidase
MRDYFTRADGSDELMCKCGKCNQTVKPEFRELLNKARALANVPFNVTSGMRCLKHNRNIESRDTSTHIKGLAADIFYSDDLHLARIVHACSRVGITRLGVNKNKKFIHLDKDEIKPDAVFGYK